MKVPAWMALGLWVAMYTAIALVWLFSNFETRGHADETKSDVIQRLQRIEDKIDRFMEDKK